jgi:pyruvate/2-oxoglutarate dehydrogenase complex dihydrolipoamide dehydrogenase (E3) component
MSRVMGDKVGQVFRGLLEKNGVKFKMGASVEKATPSKSDSSKVGAVHLKDGTTLEADIVIEGVGVAPATEYLKENGSVQLEKDGSLRTNESFEVQGLKDVFAIGDIVSNVPIRLPQGSTHPVHSRCVELLHARKFLRDGKPTKAPLIELSRYPSLRELPMGHY